MSENKIATSVYLGRPIRQKLKRIANILDVTETSLVEKALEYYFSKSKITREALRKCREKETFFRGLNEDYQLQNLTVPRSQICGFEGQIKEDE